jgi:hypothetical protein
MPMNDGDVNAHLPRVECSITFISESEGGRSHPPPHLSGDVYRPHLVIGDPTQRHPILVEGNRSAEEHLGIAFHQGPADASVGFEMKAIITLMYYPRLSYENLKPGVTFTIREGPKIVGFGSVLRLLNS